MIAVLRFAPYLAVGLLVWWVMDMRASIADLTGANEILGRQLAACSARANNLMEDDKSDAEIDNIPDDGLTVVPDHWLLLDDAGDAGGTTTD